MTRDLTKAQFDAKCREYGFKPKGFWGYYEVGCGVSVSIFNAGDRRRSQLAYLIQQRDEIAKRHSEPSAAIAKATGKE